MGPLSRPNHRQLSYHLARRVSGRRVEPVYQSKSFASRNFALCIREHGDKAKSIWTHLDDSASAWSSLLGRRFLPLGSPASAGLFWAPALPKLNRSPSEAPIRLTRVTAGF